MRPEPAKRDGPVHRQESGGEPGSERTVVPLPRFSSRVARAILIGLPGIVLLPFVLAAPDGVPVAAIVINPLFLVVLAAVAGGWAAPGSGLQSALILCSPLRLPGLARWLLAGLAFGFIVAHADHALAPLWRDVPASTLREGRDASDVALGVLYGGLTEEIIMRWGLMTILTAGLIRLLPRRHALQMAVALAALVFALAHLPAVVVEAGTLPQGLLVRTLLWNLLLGLTYGVAFARHGLEAAILAHMGTHLGFALAAF